MPNRILKESICTSDTLECLSWFEEVFFYRLLVNCDDYGRCDARPAVLKSRLFPLKDRITLKNVSDALQKLARIGCVKLYECDSKPYLYLPTWELHQTIRAKKSKYPAPDESVQAYESICKQMQADESICLRNPIQSESNPNPNPNPNAQAREVEARFAAFWDSYPKKQGKGAALKIFLKIKPSQELFEAMLNAIKCQRKSDQWQKEGGRFIPYPATWLNQRRWEDEIETEVSTYGGVKLDGIIEVL